MHAPEHAYMATFGLAVLAALLVSGGLVWASLYINRSLIRPEDDRAVQCMHRRAAPRFGGVAIILGLVCAALLSDSGSRELWGLLCLAALPVVLAGLLEDSGRRVRPLWRLIAAAVSGVLAIVMFRLWIPALDVPYLDTVMGWTPFAIAFTILCIAGISHAFNLVDGLNGLAGSIAIAIALGLGSIAVAEGHFDIALIAYAAIGATLGFLILNFPFGRLFLGDAGAYGLGFLLIWLGIMLVARSDAVTAWALLLIFFWPVADTLLAIWRRLRNGRPIGQPDRLHYHQFVLRALEITLLGKNRRHIANPLTTLLLMPFFAAPVVAGVVLRDAPMAAALACLAFGVAFFSSYAVGIWLAASRRRLWPEKSRWNTLATPGSTG